MCNYSTNANITLNTTSTEFNVTNGNSSDLNSCEKCFLATPLSEVRQHLNTHFGCKEDVFRYFLKVEAKMPLYARKTISLGGSNPVQLESLMEIHQVMT